MDTVYYVKYGHYKSCMFIEIHLGVLIFSHPEIFSCCSPITPHIVNDHPICQLAVKY